MGDQETNRGEGHVQLCKPCSWFQASPWNLSIEERHRQMFSVQSHKWAVLVEQMSCGENDKDPCVPETQHGRALRHTPIRRCRRRRPRRVWDFFVRIIRSQWPHDSLSCPVWVCLKICQAIWHFHIHQSLNALRCRLSDAVSSGRWVNSSLHFLFVWERARVSEVRCCRIVQHVTQPSPVHAPDGASAMTPAHVQQAVCFVDALPLGAALHTAWTMICPLVWHPAIEAAMALPWLLAGITAFTYQIITHHRGPIEEVAAEASDIGSERNLEYCWSSRCSLL